MASRDPPFTRIRPKAEQEFQKLLEAELETVKIDWNRKESTTSNCESEKRCRVASSTMECSKKKKSKNVSSFFVFLLNLRVKGCIGKLTTDSHVEAYKIKKRKWHTI